jgi:hypothetical protein
MLVRSKEMGSASETHGASLSILSAGETMRDVLLANEACGVESKVVRGGAVSACGLLVDSSAFDARGIDARAQQTSLTLKITSIIATQGNCFGGTSSPQTVDS